MPDTFPSSFLEGRFIRRRRPGLEKTSAWNTQIVHMEQLSLIRMAETALETWKENFILNNGWAINLNLENIRVEY